MRFTAAAFPFLCVITCTPTYASYQLRRRTTTRIAEAFDSKQETKVGPTCAQGYTCWEDETGSLWAKTKGATTIMDCKSVCHAAFQENSTFYTCKQNVDASNATLAAVAAGMSFSCKGSQEYPGRCWGMESPVNGTILVTGDDQEDSKNCYLPPGATATVRCDVPVENANCFGEYFSSICPCIQGEDKAIVSSKQWRLYTHKSYPKTGGKWSWSLDNILVYTSHDCSGTEVDWSAATITDSQHHTSASDVWSPKNAMGNSTPGRWGGIWDNPVDGNLWIAIEYPIAVEVGCVQFDQVGDNYAQHIKLQALSQGTTMWKTAKFVNDAHEGSNTIEVADPSSPAPNAASPTTGVPTTVGPNVPPGSPLASAACKQWRLYTHKSYPRTGGKWSWSLDNILVYASHDCSGTEVDWSAATITDSQHHASASNAWSPKNAMGNNTPGRWGGIWDNPVDGNLWLAIEYPIAVEVGCVQFDQVGEHFAQQIDLQALPQGSTIWETVKFVNDAHEGSNTIQV